MSTSPTLPLSTGRSGLSMALLSPVAYLMYAANQAWRQADGPGASLIFVLRQGARHEDLKIPDYCPRWTFIQSWANPTAERAEKVRHVAPPTTPTFTSVVSASNAFPRSP